MKKENAGCLLQCAAIVVINIVGVYLARAYPFVRTCIELALSVYFLLFILSLILGGIKGKIGEFFMNFAGTSRFYLLFFFPIILAAVLD